MAIFTPDYEVLKVQRAVRACVKTWSQEDGGGVSLSPLLMTDAEIDEVVNARIAEWEKLRGKLKKALRKVRQ
jgi:hypothetical protein